MKSEARLDWAVFQLTPTRTRCDLVISANGKTEKIASGLLNPFLAHLKSAQDQISKGGYSIKLEPDAEINAVWFTKGTVERFVRFVSTPEILERVTTIESEILQIEEAISIQSSDTLNLATADDHQHKSTEYTEGANGDSDKAIVIYKPGSQPQQTTSNGNSTQEENSKVQLLKVLESRRNVLRKEQGMAFARAVAAGFDMETLPLLLAFSECFGASRLLKGSSQFMELWKRKHETGQWVEVEAIENMSMRSEIPPFQIPPILLNPEGSENPDSKSDQKGGYYQGQFYPPWPMPYPPPPHYPYYQNYPYAPPSESHHNHSHSRVSKRGESDSRSHTGTGTDHESSDSDEISVSHKSHHKKGSSGKKKKKNNQTVVIKNLNYITKKLNGLDSGSESGSGSDKSDSDSTDSDEKSKKHKKSSKKKNKHAKNEDSPRDSRNRDSAVYEDRQMEGDSGNWNAFQSFLLKAEEKSTVNDSDMFSSEREPVRRENRRNGTGFATGTDPFLTERDFETGQERRTGGFDSVNGRVSRSRAISSNDEMFMSGERGSNDMMGLKEIEGGGTYRRTGRTGTSEEFMLYGQEKQMVGTNKGYLDPSIEGRYNNSSNNNNKSYDGNDESFIIASRSGLDNNNFGTERRNTIDIDSELQRKDEISPPAVSKSQVFYEPEELTMNRGFEPVKTNLYDPIVDYESEMHVEKIVKVEEVVQEEEALPVKEEGKVEGKERKVRKSQDGVLDRKRKEALVRRLSGPGSSRNPLAEAQKRAQNLRSYKADLQKLKKEQEEEQIKRLEALKLERQKRIAARSSSTNPTQSKSKASPNSTQKPSKFTDSDPNSTPIRKIATKTTPSKSNGSGNGLTRSVSSLSETRKERNGSGNPKRLSEPTRSVTTVRKRVVKEESSNKKVSKEILQLDQSKSATLPEIKINVNKNDKVSVKKEKMGGASESVRAESEVVVEKKVVSVENEVAVPVLVSVPVSVRKEEKVEERESKVVGGEREERREKIEVYEAVRAPPSPVVESEASHEVVIEHVKEEPKIPQIPQNLNVEKPKIPQIPQISQNPNVEKPYQIPRNPNIEKPHQIPQIPQIPQNRTVEKPYQAPVARLSSLEPLPESPAGSETERIKAHVAINSPDRVHVDHTQELTIGGGEKQKGKGGFRKLLKFGRKKGEGSHVESDVSSVDDVAESSNDGHLLKNLISQDDTKVSKSFSLLSPFRRDKKVIYL
ncbi:hypothetical protein LUZ60_002298 [Juncus effusus]|nr:hypothetical protein LUZ60_002298 [Juncus effusus]